MFARLFTADIGVSTFPIGNLFYLQTDLNARGPESRRGRMLFSDVLEKHRLFVYPTHGWYSVPIISPSTLSLLPSTGDLSPHYP